MRVDIMKPKNWDKLDWNTKVKIATELYGSERGAYIISQALSIAIKTMKKQKCPEVSNIQDMEMLQEVLFPFYKYVEKAMENVENNMRDR